MKKTKKTNTSIEQELSKQMDEIDRRFDRGGWFYMIIVILLLFIGIYVLITYFQIPSDEREDINEAHQSLVDRVDSLESRLIELEQQSEE
ncbi:hypothetical protein [Fundicoccus culcitae]|uniref:Uncharacterized protein n=1 Tax=Fundicoccus culcitae TaxID=2969821 RepID=A0ABY5P525_9LACT|nr:hypothetical protein [Fundicoccus culcitae]UUX33842.1 hypothetical protein NRE15_13300 [Fundicoccus culcitae]